MAKTTVYGYDNGTRRQTKYSKLSAVTYLFSIYLLLGATEVRATAPAQSERPYREERQHPESFSENSDVKEETQRSYVDHYHDKPATFDYERPSEHLNDRREGERWFNEHALNIHHPRNDIRKAHSRVLFAFV